MQVIKRHEDREIEQPDLTGMESRQGSGSSVNFMEDTYFCLDLSLILFDNFRMLKLILTCFLFAQISSAGETNQTRIGVIPWPGYDFLALAEKKGLFNQHGVNVKLINFAYISDMKNAFRRGQLDGIAATTVDAYLNFQKSHKNPCQIIATFDYSAGGDVLIAGPQIKNVAQLKGKTLGLEVMSLSSYMLARILTKYQLKESDLKLRPYMHMEMPGAIASGAVDAVITFPPSSIEVLKVKGTKVLFSSKEIPGEVLDVLLLTKKVISERPHDAEGIARALDEAIDYHRNFPMEAENIMAKSAGVALTDWRDGFSGLKMVTRDELQRSFKDGQTLKDILKTVEEVVSPKIRNPEKWDIESVIEPLMRYSGRK